MTSRKRRAERRRWLVLSLLLALLGPLPAALAAADVSAPVSLSRFAGRWERVGSDPEDERLAAISEAIAELSWVMRGIAGPLLRQSTLPSDFYVFEVDGAEVRMGSHGRPPSRLALDGQSRAHEDDRGAFEVTSERRAGGIRTTWHSEQAHGSNTFEVADSGERLVVRTTLVVTAISGVEPIAYVEHFRRSADTTAPSPAD